MLDQTTCAISEYPLFARLSDEITSCLLARGIERHYGRGEVICLQSEPARTLKIITHGLVKLYRVSPSGDEAILSTLGCGSSFDEVGALRGGASKLSVEAMSDCTILHIDLNALCSCKGAREEIAAAVLAEASEKMDELIIQLEGLKIKTGLQRLSEFLLEQVETDARRAELELPYDKVILASKLGMQPESLSRALKRLKPLGVRSNRRDFRIDDVAALRGFVEEMAAA